MIHKETKRIWDPRTWVYPKIHNFEFGFGLSAEDTTRASTIVPYFFQDNALVDYENEKTNPRNDDFAISTEPNVCQGSYIPNIVLDYVMYLKPDDTEISHLMVDRMKLFTAFDRRLDAKDKKTGATVKSIIEMQYETTDEQAYPLWNGTKLFESGGTYDYSANVPGLTTDGQPEGVAFDKETFFDGIHYYSNANALKTVTGPMRSVTISEPIVPHGMSIVHYRKVVSVPSIAKFQNEYTFFGELFSVPQVGSRTQYHLASETTGIEHLTVKGMVRFNEYNPDFNFARA
jgi:hypothetical protein